MSDFEEHVSAAMSLKVPISKHVFDGDPFMAGWSEGYDEGRAQGRNDVEAILLDLIAELVGDDGDGHELTPGKDDTCLVCECIDRAEARLREVAE